jgi:hypothetical protein
MVVLAAPHVWKALRLHESTAVGSNGAVCFHEKIITIGYFRAYTPAVTLL